MKLCSERPFVLISIKCEGAVMIADANARTFLSMLLFYAVSNVCFQTKTSETFIWYKQRLFGTDNPSAAPRIAVRE